MFGELASIDQNLILTGYIGPGQLAIARKTAEALRLPFVDYETRLEEAAGMPGEDVRALFGEKRLESLEKSLVDEISLYRGTLIHISGQTLHIADHFERLRVTGTIICLVASVDAVLQRLHLAMGARFHNPAERDIAVGTLRREWAVRKLPGIHEIDTSLLDDEQTIRAIARTWRERAAVIDWRTA
ncbi:hypothetical protein FBR02_13230 [Anaerolineae bacterium CFX9]|jgi:shikimate kinase|nr:hypothetical protein [Anaerolineae bacterium CFX9]